MAVCSYPHGSTCIAMWHAGYVLYRALVWSAFLHWDVLYLAHVFPSVDAPVATLGMLQHFFLVSNEMCPNVAVLFVIHEMQHVVPLNYELIVSSSDGCTLQECPMLLSRGERIRSVTLMDGVHYTATLVVSNGCGSGSTTVSIIPQGKTRNILLCLESQYCAS